VRSIAPSVTPLQLAPDTAPLVASAAGDVTVMVVTPVQPLASVAVTVYTPAARPLTLAPVAPPGLHKYVYGAAPPLADALAAPLAAPKQLTACVADPLTAMAGHSTASVYAWLPVQPFASVAVTVKPELPSVGGVPLSTPFAASDSPAGSAPDVTEYVYAASPPVADSVWLYAASLVAAGRASGDSVIGAHTRSPTTNAPNEPKPCPSVCVASTAMLRAGADHAEPSHLRATNASGSAPPTRSPGANSKRMSYTVGEKPDAVSIHVRFAYFVALMPAPARLSEPSPSLLPAVSVPAPLTPYSVTWTGA